MNITDWLIGISALATLALAIAAFLSIRENRRMREDNFKMQCLDAVLDWARTGVSILSEDISLQHRHNLELLTNRLLPSHVKRDGVLRLSRNFGIDFINVVFKAVTRLEQFFSLVSKMAQGSPEPEATEKQKLLETKEEALQSFVNLLESANNLKVELQL